MASIPKIIHCRWFGGVYFDTDAEVIKPMGEILKRGAFAGDWGCKRK